MVMKQAGFHGMSEFYQSCVAQHDKNYGEEIARLQVGLIHLARLSQTSIYMPDHMLASFIL